MNDCPTCGFPMAWSETHEREWCAVYGNHPARRPSALMLSADIQNHAVPFGVKAPHGRAA